MGWVYLHSNGVTNATLLQILQMRPPPTLMLAGGEYGVRGAGARLRVMLGVDMDIPLPFLTGLLMQLLIW